MGEIIFFSNKEEGDPDNGLAQPYPNLRGWNAGDERRRPEFRGLVKRYPEGFSRRATGAIINAQRRAIYPEAYDPEASAKYVERRSKPAVETKAASVETKPIKYEDSRFHDIPRRVFEAIRQMTHPRRMQAPAVGHIAGTKIKRARMPGPTRAAVRDALRNLLKHL